MINCQTTFLVSPGSMVQMVPKLTHINLYERTCLIGDIFYWRNLKEDMSYVRKCLIEGHNLLEDMS